MITYEAISQTPQAANSPIGISLAEFETLYAQFRPTYEAREATFESRGRHAGRRRAAGAGRKHEYSLRDRLLMTLFWQYGR